jgi:hypothetical protein
MEITEISFSDQGRKCKESDNIIYEKCGWCGHTNIMCKKYGGVCKSIKCLEDRKRLMEKDLTSEN